MAGNGVLERPVLSLDAKTNGLCGQGFAIGALVYNEAGEEADRFFGRLPDYAVTNLWVHENVLPKLRGIRITHYDYDSLLASFADFYLTHRLGADVLAHMGYFAEAGVFRDMHTRRLIHDDEAPRPLLDVSGNLQQAGEDPNSVEAYISKHGLTVRNFEGENQNPLYDAEAAYVAYHHLMLGRVAIDGGSSS